MWLCRSNLPSLPRGPNLAGIAAAASTATAALSGAGALTGASAALSSATGTLSAAGALADEVGVTDQFTAVLTRYSFPPEWGAERQQAIQLLADLNRAIREVEPALKLVEDIRHWAADHPGIGHNQPPEQVEALPTVNEIVTEATVAADALLAELASDQPHLSSIRLASRALSRVAGWIEAVGVWGAKKADLFLDEFVKQSGKRAADATWVFIGAKLAGVTTLIAAITALVVSLIGHL
jgi:hypothetical protein